YEADIPGSAQFLTQLGVFNTSPTDHDGAGIWQSGLGLASDGDGTVYCMTGNGNFNRNTGSYGNTVLRLRLPSNAASKEMEVVDFFTPYDWASRYNPQDQDLGSGGPVLVGHEGGPPGLQLVYGAQHFILAGGKVSKSYLLDRDCVNCSGDPDRCKATTGQGC